MGTDEHAPAEAQVLRFFVIQRDGVTGKRLRRLRDAELALRRCLDDHAEAFSTGADLALLRLEQQFAPAGAGARLAPVDVVLRALEPYLTDERYAGADDVDRNLRLRLAWRLGLLLIDSLDADEAARVEHLQVLHEVHLAGRRCARRVRRAEAEARMRASMTTMAPARRAAMAKLLDDLERWSAPGGLREPGVVAKGQAPDAS